MPGGCLRVRGIKSVDSLLNDILTHIDLDNVGMVLVHKGIVRGVSREGKKVKALKVSFNGEDIQKIEREFSQKIGVEYVKIEVNSGYLNVGDEIMTIVIAGRYRSEVLSTFAELLDRVKSVITEEEILT